MPHIESAGRRVIVSLDMEHYSKKDGPGQFRGQGAFREILDEASNNSGLDIRRWETEVAGDSVLAVLPVDVAESLVVGDLAGHLEGLLRDHNNGRDEHGRIRLRMAVHEGPVLHAANGWSGDAVNFTCRLRDADALRAAHKALPDAPLALIVSERIYEDIVAPRYGRVRSDRFRQVPVSVAGKDFAATAWITIPGEDMGRIAPDMPSAPAPQVQQPTVPAAKFAFGQIHSSGTMAVGDNATVWNTPNGWQR